MLLLLANTPSVSYILNADGEKGMTIEETYTAAQVLIVAGSETSATALCGSTYLLLSNPQTLSKLTAEVRTAFKTEAEILPHNTAALPYLNAVVEEALRLCPPGPGTFPRRVPEGGRVVCDRFVPGGVAVGVHQVSTHRDPRNFVRAADFRPERWLGDPEFEGDNRACFREFCCLPSFLPTSPHCGVSWLTSGKTQDPFSFGPRNCIGKK